jgi:hypothetical protein
LKKMLKLTLNDAVSCSVTHAELSKYPDSLLSSIVACSNQPGTTEHAGSKRARVEVIDDDAEGDATIKLEDLPENPFKEWPAAVQTIQGLYRYARAVHYLT